MGDGYRGEFRRGWLLVLAASLGGGAVLAHFATMSFFIPPIVAGTGWTPSQITFGLLICSATTIPGAPLAGWLLDRFGPGRVVLTGLPLFFLAFGAIGALATNSTGWTLAWGLLALVSIPLKTNLWVAWVAREFDAARGIAIALAISGTGVFALVLPFLTREAIALAGWRGAYAMIAGALALVCLPLCYLAWRRSRSGNAPGEGGGRSGSTGMTFGQALATNAFWQLLVASLLAGWGITSLQLFIAPMLLEKGLEKETVVMLAGVLSVSALVGRLAMGVLLDWLPARQLGIATMFLPAFACLLYLNAPVDFFLSAVIAVLFGIAIGAEGVVMAYLTSRYFGLRRFGLIFGCMLSAVSVGSGAGPFTTALVRNLFGHSGPVVATILVVMLAAAVLIGTLGKYSNLPDKFVPIR